jgi:hypothetical protein
MRQALRQNSVLVTANVVEGQMERTNTGIENAPGLTVKLSNKVTSGPIARHHQRWLIQSGFAEQRDGRLRPTAHGHEVGAALFGYTR